MLKRPREAAQSIPVPDERIRLNVGGRIFETLTSTLVMNSSYFAAKYSMEWQQAPQAQEVFLDHDPNLFQILLSYMRYGSLDVKDLNKEVLVLAEYLGVDRLVRAAKLLLARNCGMAGSTEDELLQNLERQKGPLQHWAATDIQRYLTGEFPMEEQQIEFASVYLHKPHEGFPGKFMAPPYRAGLRTMFHRRHHAQHDSSSSSSEEEGDAALQPEENNDGTRPEFDELSDKGGFFMPVFALNWLGKHGFEVAPQSLQTFNDAKRVGQPQPFSEFDTPCPSSTGQFLDELLFVRRVPPPSSRSNSSNNSRASSPSASVNEEHAVEDPVIITHNNNNNNNKPQRTSTQPLCSHPKEYATVNAVIDMGNRVFVQCAGGEVQDIPRLDQTHLRRTGRLHCFNMICALEWLRKHGFTQKEPILEAFLSRAQEETSDGFYGPTMVFSRPLCESHELIPERHLVGVNFKDKVRRANYRWVNHDNAGGGGGGGGPVEI